MECPCLYVLVSADVNLSHLHLLLLVDIHIDLNHVFLHWVVSLHYLHPCIAETLLVEVVLYNNLSLVNHVWSELVTLSQSHLLHEVFLLALLHTPYVDL